MSKQVPDSDGSEIMMKFSLMEFYFAISIPFICHNVLNHPEIWLLKTAERFKEQFANTLPHPLLPGMKHTKAEDCLVRPLL